MTKVEKFTVTEEHIKLLRNANVSWMNMENGAPCIDPKRPYGNSYMYGDLARMLKYQAYGNSDYKDEEKNYMDKIHAETKIALEIFLRTGSMVAGDYIKNGYYEPWIKVND